MKKFDWTSIDELLMKELICNFNYIDQYIKFKGRQVDVGERISQFFELFLGRIHVGRIRRLEP